MRTIKRSFFATGSIGASVRSTRLLRLLLSAVGLFLPGAAQASNTTRAPGKIEPSSIRFVDATERSQIDFDHHDGSSGQQYLVELMGAGMASLDYDNDGRIDCYFLNGCHLSPEMSTEEEGSRNQLFRNLGQFQFQNSGSPSHSGDRGFGLGIAAADFNEDGFVDLYINNFGPNVLLTNNGDGTFTDTTIQANVIGEDQFGAGVAFFDADQDGDLDLFAGNYVEFSFERHAERAPSATPFPPGPKDYRWPHDTFFVNDGDGTFHDASVESGINAAKGPTMGVTAGDFDADGDIDVVAVSDGAPNHLFINDGDGNFREEAVLYGIAYDLKGVANGNMGVDAADVDGDQLDDLMVTTYTGQLPVLFLNSPDGIYEDVTRRTRIGTDVLPHVNWTVGLVDLDLDGDRDAFICNGHFLKNAKELFGATDFAVPNSIMMNQGPVFVSVTDSAGEALTHSGSSRGAVFEDLDLDGDIDAAILNCNAKAQVLENVSQVDHHWLQVRLVGTSDNRSGIGAKVLVTSGGRVQIAERRSGRGYQSDFGSQLHFGLGSSEIVDSVVIQWPNGQTQELHDVPGDQVIEVIQVRQVNP